MLVSRGNSRTAVVQVHVSSKGHLAQAHLSYPRTAIFGTKDVRMISTALGS